MTNAAPGDVAEAAIDENQPNFGAPVRWLRLGGLELHLFHVDEQPPYTYQHFGFEVDDFDVAQEKARDLSEIVAITRSEKGSVVLSGKETHVIPGRKVDVVDTTGAGDAYAAGFLYGYTQGRSLDVCGNLGGIVASEAISHYGPRAESDLKELTVGV